jgi:hypothetical protein
MKAEHLKEWLCGIRREETEESAGRGRGLLEVVCSTGTGNLRKRHHVNSDELDGNRAPPERWGGDYCGIGLLDPMLKVVEKIMVA